MDAPTAEQIRSWSQLDFGSLGYPEGGNPDPLDELVARAGAFFGEIAGLGFDPVTDAALVVVPDRLAPLVRQAVQRMVELLAVQSQEDVIETLGDFQLLSSFSAGNYSETRRSLSELQKNQMIVADPTLNGLLWALMTPEKRSFWFAWLSGTNEPAFDIVEVDWNAPHLVGYFYGSPFGHLPAIDWPRGDGGW